MKAKEIEWSPGTPMSKEFAVEFLRILKREAEQLHKQGYAGFDCNADIVEGIIELINENCISRWVFILQTTLSVVALIIALSTLI